LHKSWDKTKIILKIRMNFMTNQIQ